MNGRTNQPRTVGVTMRLALSTARIGGAEALATGLVQQVVPLAELDAAVDKTAAMGCGFPAAWSACTSSTPFR